MQSPGSGGSSFSAHLESTVQAWDEMAEQNCTISLESRPKSPPRRSIPTDSFNPLLPQPWHKASSMPREREREANTQERESTVQEAQVSYGLTSDRAESYGRQD